jgi:hypothetical protein
MYGKRDLHVFFSSYPPCCPRARAAQNGAAQKKFPCSAIFFPLILLVVLAHVQRKMERLCESRLRADDDGGDEGAQFQTDRYAKKSKETRRMAKETYHTARVAKETYHTARETYHMTKETYHMAKET